MKKLILLLSFLTIPFSYAIESGQFVNLEDQDSYQKMTLECSTEECLEVIVTSYNEGWPYNRDGLVRQYVVNKDELLTKEKVPRREYIQGAHIEDHIFVVTRHENGPLKDTIELFEDGYYIEGVGAAGLTALFAITLDFFIISPAALIVSVAGGTSNKSKRTSAVYKNKVLNVIESDKDAISVKGKYYNNFLKIIKERATDTVELQTNIGVYE